jgi:hypothetical protein
MRSKACAATASVLLAAMPTFALAQLDTSRPVRALVGIGVTGGGDKLATVQWSNGDSTNINAGGQVDLRAGVDVRLGDSPFSLVASIGWFSQRAGGRNGSVTFERFPLELMAQFNIAEQFRIGGGVRRTGDAKLRGRGAASNIGTTTFDGKIGYVLEGEWLFARRYGVALRAVGEDYTAPSGEKADGGHVGVRFNVYF